MSYFGRSRPAGSTELIASGTITDTDADFTITNLSDEYESYRIYMTDFQTETDGSAAYLRFSDDGGSTYEADASDYKYNVASGSYGIGSAYNVTGATAAQIRFQQNGGGNAAGETADFVFELFDPVSSSSYATATWTGRYPNADSNHYLEHGSGQMAAASSVTAIQFLPASGTWKQGKWECYGVRKTGSLDNRSVGAWTLGTAVDLSSGSPTEADWTAIPPGVTTINLSLAGVARSAGSENLLVQIGDSGGLETSGYESSSAIDATVVASTAGFIIQSDTNTNSGMVTLTLLDESQNLWASTHEIDRGTTNSNTHGGGSKALSGTLDRVRLKWVNGTDTFSAGDANIQYAFQTNKANNLSALNDVTTEAMGASQDTYVLAWNDSSEVWEDTAPWRSDTTTELAAEGNTITGIEANATNVKVCLIGASLDGSDNILVRLGDAAEVQATGYTSTAGGVGVSTSSTTGMLIQHASASIALTTVMDFVHVGGNQWVQSHASGRHGGAGDGSYGGGGYVTLGDTLTRIQILPVGTDEFDAGDVQVVWS